MQRIRHESTPLISATGSEIAADWDTDYWWAVSRNHGILSG